MIDKGDEASVHAGIQPLKPEDIANTIGFCLTCDHHVNITEMTVHPISQASVHQIHRDK